MPVFLSDIPGLFVTRRIPHELRSRSSKGRVKLDVAVPQRLEGPQCGAFLGGTNPRPNEGSITLQCVPRTVACP